jgi:hypothetical protein
MRATHSTDLYDITATHDGLGAGTHTGLVLDNGGVLN